MIDKRLHMFSVSLVFLCELMARINDSLLIIE